MIELGGPTIGWKEKAAVWQQMSSGQLAQGARVRQFEQAFGEHFGLGEIVAVNSGTSALHIGNLALGLGPGDEVILPSFSFAASANSVALTGATPVFCDIDLGTFTASPESIQSLITPRTKAIMVVHLYGQMADMVSISKIARENGLFLIEDAAQAHGAMVANQPAGSWGDFGAFSFYPTKNMTTGEGGAISVADPDLERLCRLLRNQGMIERYRNEVVGLNNRMTEISAVIGLAQLKRIEALTERRIRNAGILSEMLGDVNGLFVPRVRENSKHVFHQFTIRVADGRDELVKNLRLHGVQAGVYYPTPIHRLPAYDSKLQLPNSELAATQCLSIPVHPRLRVDQIKAVARAVKKALAAS